MSMQKTRGLATSSDHDRISPKRYAPRVGETALSEKASVSRRRNPYFASLPFLTAGARVLETNISFACVCAQK